MIITTTTNEIQLFMNTWENYNNNGADISLINGGWMSIEEAREFIEEQTNNSPFINDTNGEIPFEINEYSNVKETLEALEKYSGMDDTEVIDTIIEATGYDFDKCMEIYENGDYIYYSCISDEYDLGLAVVQENGILDTYDDLLVRYFDYESYGRDLVIEGFYIGNNGAILIQ